MQIVEAAITHLSDVVKLFKAYLAFYDVEQSGAEIEHFLSDRLTQADSKIFIAYAAPNTPAGFIQLYPSFSSLMLQRFWILNDLYVAEEHRSKGVAKALIECAKQLCYESNACGMMLDTQKSNQQAQHVYKQCDFTLNTSSNYYYWFTAGSYLDTY